jgi:hypothetical protein
VRQPEQRIVVAELIDGAGGLLAGQQCAPSGRARNSRDRPRRGTFPAWQGLSVVTPG